MIKYEEEKVLPLIRILEDINGGYRPDCIYLPMTHLPERLLNVTLRPSNDDQVKVEFSNRKLTPMCAGGGPLAGGESWPKDTLGLEESRNRCVARVLRNFEQGRCLSDGLGI